ncbi:MAG: precorrin-4 C(11)-methyltransferase [Lachnospiraceae bacterium]|nr:precorrin-4 C(11)-methyltransferase [Lachnospiraceae bacterium]
MVHFVGAGSGGADLITVRGAKLLSEAGVVIYAGSLINPEVLESYVSPGAELFDSSRMTLEEVVEVMRASFREGKEVVRLHSGEPSIFGAVREQMDELDRLGIEYDSTPGVTACFAAASSLNLEYTLPGVSQTLIITRLEGRTGVPEKESIESLASHGSSMAVYLSASMLDELSGRLLKGGLSPDTPAAVVYKASWEDEKKVICTVGTLPEEAARAGIKRLAVVLVGEAVTHSAFERSRLYDPCFETGYRKGSEND